MDSPHKGLVILKVDVFFHAIVDQVFSDTIGHQWTIGRLAVEQ